MVVPKIAQMEVLQAVQSLLPGFHADLAKSVTPLVGVFVSGGTALWNFGNAIHKEYGIYASQKRMENSLAGKTGEAAINAMIRILRREANADWYSGSVSLTEFGLKVAGLAADGGMATTAATGLAANLAKLMNILRIICRDVQEKNAANALMRRDRIDLTLFETCPLAGAYLVCAAPTSVLMSLVLDRFGEAGWMDLVERANPHVTELRATARYVIAYHRFEIATLARCPGMLYENTDELTRMRENVDRRRLQT